MTMLSTLRSLITKFIRIGQHQFGGSVTNSCLDFILQNGSEGEILIELGSGKSTRLFSDKFHVHTVEHSRSFLKNNMPYMTGGKYPVHFIHSPIIKGWYDPDVLKERLPKQAEIVLVDGPPGYIGREGILEHLEMFSSARLMIFDDVNRPKEHQILLEAARKLNRNYTIHGDSKKKWGVITR